MPRRSRALDPAEGPLARMALDLRRLRDMAPAGRPQTVDEVADQEGVRTSRAAIYAALAGRRLVSREALTAMVKAWSPNSLDDLPSWMLRRRKCEDELMQPNMMPAYMEERAARSGASSVSDRPFSLESRKPVSGAAAQGGYQFNELVLRVHSEAGQPSLRELSRRSRSMGHAVGVSTLYNLIRGKGFPSLATLTAFIAATNPDEQARERLIELWNNLQDGKRFSRGED